MTIVSQNFIESGEISIFNIMRYPQNKKNKGSVLLIPGFGESKCDIDYFLCDTSNYLLENEFCVMQLDLFAHGDSCGKFEELNCKIITENIISAVKYLKRDLEQKVYIVCRGFYLELICEQNILNDVDGIIGISPIKLERDEMKKIEQVLNITKDIQAFEKIENQESLSKIITMLGAEPDNIYAQKVNKEFLQEIISTLKENKWATTAYRNIVWISANAECNDVNIDYDYSKVQYKTLDFYEGYAFPRDICWKHKFIMNTISNIIRMSKETNI